MARNLSKQTIRDYVGLYLWLKKEMANPDWRDVTAYLHGKAGYHDVTETYIAFKKEFEAATRGYVENKGITSAKNLTDAQIEELRPMLDKISDKGSIKTFNLMLGNVFGNDAGRYIALMTAMEAEARADKLARELAAEKEKNSQLRALNISVSTIVEDKLLNMLKQEFVKVNESLAIISQNIAANNAAGSGTVDASGRIMTKIHNLEQALWSQLSNLSKMVADLSTELGITSATVISIADVQNRMYGDIIDIKTSQDSTKIDIAAIRTEIEQINIAMQNYFAAPPVPPTPPTTPTPAPSGVSKGWKVGTLIAGGLAIALLGTTIWAGTYHGQISDLKNDNSSLSAQAQQQQGVIDQLQANFDSLLLKYEELQKAPTQAALVDYINLRQDLDVMFIVALNDNRITAEEADQIRVMAEQIAHIDISISLANPNLGEFVNSVLNTIEKYDMTISTLNAKITELENIIASTDDEAVITQLLEQKAQLEAEKERIMAEFNTYKAEHSYSNDDVQKIIADYEQKLKEKGAELDELEAKLANAKTQEEYDALYAQYEAAYKNWQDTLTSYEMYKADTNAVIQGLREKIATLETKVAEQQAIIDAYEAQGPSSGISKEQYEAAIAARDKAQKDLAAEQKAHAETKALLDQANAAIASLNTTVNNLRNEFNAYKANHNYTDAQYQQIQAAFDKLQDDYDDAIEQLQNAVTKEEYQAAVARLAAFQAQADSAYEQFYGMAGDCTPEQFAAILSYFGFSVQQNPGDATPNINQPGN